MAEIFGVDVFGIGYARLVTGVCLSHLGHRVVCKNKDEERIRRPRSKGRRLDLARASGTLSREPRTPAREGLKKTLRWLAEPSGRVREVC